MTLLDSFIRKLPPLYQSKFQKPRMVQCMFFIPGIMRYWFPMEYDGKNTFFGLTVSETEVKLDFFTMSELEDTRGPGNIEVGLDIAFKPTPLSEVLKNFRAIREA